MCTQRRVRNAQFCDRLDQFNLSSVISLQFVEIHLLMVGLISRLFCATEPLCQCYISTRVVHETLSQNSANTSN